MYITYYYCLRTNTFFLKGFDWTVVLCDLCCVLAGRKRAIKTLKPSFFVSGVVGTFVGFPRIKRVVDGFARCRLCRVDLSIAGRGLHNLWDHWKGREHTRLEQRFRIMSNRPLLDKSCRPVSLDEDRKIRAARVSEPPVILESEVKLTVEERIAVELEEEAAGSEPELSESSASYLWLCCFINNFVELRDFSSVVRSMEVWSSSMRGELVFSERVLSYPKCQVIHVLFVSFFCVVFVKVGSCLLVRVCSCWLFSLAVLAEKCHRCIFVVESCVIRPVSICHGETERSTLCWGAVWSARPH